MRKVTLFISILLVFTLLFAGCSDLQNIQNTSDTVDLPVFSLEGADNEVSAAFYEKGFDYKYDNLPTLTLSESNGILQIALADNFGDSVQLGEDYYIYTNNQGICEKETYDLMKDEDGIVSLAISRRGTAKDENAIYYLKNEQGTFVFKIILPLDIKN